MMFLPRQSIGSFALQQGSVKTHRKDRALCDAGLALVLLIVLLSFTVISCAHKPAAPPESTRIETPPKTVAMDTTEAPDEALFDEESEGGFDEFEDEFEEEKVEISDPLIGLNRLMFGFNDKLYFWLLKPVSRVYGAMVPPQARGCVKNFFHNLTTPVRVVSCVLQGKIGRAGVETVRFFVNTTAGVLGLGNPADTVPELAIEDDEDLGQTLAAYGIGNGPYLYLPIFGPSTLRDAVGLAGGRFLNPVTYVEPVEDSIGISAFETVNKTSFRIGDYEALKEATLDPYTALRNAYLQRRIKKIEK